MYISSRFIILLFAASAFALDCGTRTCPDGNYCCNDAVMGPTCFDAGQAKCASTGVMAADGSGMTARLCGISDAACGNICFNPESYYCCNGQLLQNSQPCNSSPTGSPTSPATEAPTEAPTQAATEAPTQAPTEAPTQAPTEAPTGAPTEVPTSSPTSPVNQNNCLSYGGVSGLNCSEDEICCGAGTISPSCLPADGSKQCCTWFLSATQCDADEVCGGSYGPGASSYANCGPAETQFCNFGLGSNTFCPQNQTCCGQYGSYATCCDAEDSSTDSSTAGSTSSSSSSSSPSSSSSSSSSSSPSSSSSSSTTQTANEAPVLNNCPGAANTAGVNCSETETCCGANTMTPSCLPADGSKKCCVWYLSSTQCNPDEVCGGDLGYGASSSAKCGPAGSTFCQQGDAINAFCESDSPKCCGYMSQLAFCCGSNCTCPTDGTFDCKC